MKKKNSYRDLNTKVHAKTVPISIGSKLFMLLAVIIPIAVLIAYSMNENFFFITETLSGFVLVISIAAYLKGEIIYSHPSAAHHGNISGTKTVGNKKTAMHKNHNARVSFSLNNGTVQVVISILIIILLAYLGQVIYKVMG